MTSKIFHPLCWLQAAKEKQICLVVLNCQMKNEISLLKDVWKKAIFKSCVDGAVNHLYDIMGAKREEYVPDIITGDFDSAIPAVLEFYRSKGAEIIETADQNSTDFTKNLLTVLSKVKTFQFDNILTFGCIGGHMEGRMDHFFANINTLFEIEKHTDKPVYLAANGCLVFLLKKGHNTIEVDTGFEGPHCGLIPVGCNCHVTTTGLKWNLDNQQLKFGTLVSSSNSFIGSREVTVETDQPLLWTMQYRT